MSICSFYVEHAELVEENCRNRGVRVDVGAIVELAQEKPDDRGREQHRHEQKETSARIPKTADAKKSRAHRAGKGASPARQ